MTQTCLIGLAITPAIHTLCRNIRSSECLSDDVVVDGLIPFIKDFLLLMINPETIRDDYLRYVRDGLSEVGYTHYPLSLLVDQLHTQLYNLLVQCLPCPLDKVLSLVYHSTGINDRINLMVTYESQCHTPSRPL